jgi:hemerythrin-like metal-binding protein
MVAITWSDTLALQQPRMDQTHCEFVDLLCGVEAALDAGWPALGEVFAAFVQHTVEHFAEEDAWMARLGFAPDGCHALQHAQVLEVLREVQRRLEAGGEDHLVRSLVPALAEWFPSHAQTMDAGLAQTMQQSGFDPDAGTLASPRPEPAAPRTGCGSTRCG